MTHDGELAAGTDVTLRMRDGRTERVSPPVVAEERAGMTFVLRMVGRELRASWRRLAFFFVCVAVGVSAIVALRSVIQQVGVAMAGETRALLAADVEIESEQPWSEAALATDRRRILAAEPELSRTRSIETPTMARPADESKVVARVVELRGVEAAFPFYGRFVLEDGRSYDHRPARRRGSAGTARAADPARRRGGGRHPHRRPQLRDSRRHPAGAGRGHRRVQLRPAGARRLRRPARDGAADPRHPGRAADSAEGPRGSASIRWWPRCAEPLRDEFVRVRSYRNTEDRIARNLSRAEDYLSLIGFVVVVLGGIGVWSVTRVFVQQRVRSVAVLKCLGATGRQVLAVYVAQVAVLGLGGALLGVALAAAVLASLPSSLTAQAAAVAGVDDLSYAVTGSAVVSGAGGGRPRLAPLRAWARCWRCGPSSRWP